jgi:hypothetical protein
MRPLGDNQKHFATLGKSFFSPYFSLHTRDGEVSVRIYLALAEMRATPCLPWLSGRMRMFTLGLQGVEKPSLEAP